MNARGFRLDHIDVRRLAGVEAVRLPAVIRGRFHTPTWPRVREIVEAVAHRAPSVFGPTTDGAYLVAQPVIDRQALEPTGEMRVLIVPAPDPRELVEPDPAAAIIELMRMPLDAVSRVRRRHRRKPGGPRDRPLRHRACALRDIGRR